MPRFNMETGSGFSRVNNNLLVQVSGEMNEDDLKTLKRDILNSLGRTSSRRVLINLADVSQLSGMGFALLKETARAVQVMGGQVIFAGIQPGVAAALVEFETDFTDLTTAVTIEDAMDLLEAKPKTAPFPESIWEDSGS